LETNRIVKKNSSDNLLSPLPVVLVGANVNDKPNFLVIGYICPFDFGRHIFFSLAKKRYTRIGIHQNKTFSVNIPSRDLLDRVRLCGSRSGHDTDKSGVFATFYGTLGNAPMIEECPICIECRVKEIVDYELNDGVIGQVVQSYADESCFVDGKLDYRRTDPILWATGGDYSYYALGDRLKDDDESTS
jgi:flavin reductase (DIM6/NTAB) family NADH-FMN oxidoreductase RutF